MGEVCIHFLQSFCIRLGAARLQRIHHRYESSGAKCLQLFADCFLLLNILDPQIFVLVMFLRLGVLGVWWVLPVHMVFICHITYINVDI